VHTLNKTNMHTFFFFFFFWGLNSVSRSLFWYKFFLRYPNKWREGNFSNHILQGQQNQKGYNNRKENCRPKSLVNASTKTSAKSQNNQTRKHIKKIIDHNETRFISGMQINKCDIPYEQNDDLKLFDHPKRKYNRHLVVFNMSL
jgi:hypothetical protein